MKNLKKILLITDSHRVTSGIKDALVGKFEIVSSPTIRLNQGKPGSLNFEFILIDYLVLNNFNHQIQDPQYYQDQLSEINRLYPDVRVLLLADHRKLDEASNLLNLGFHNIIQIPFSKEILELRLSIEEERVMYKEFSLAQSNSQMQELLDGIFRTENSLFQKEIEKLGLAAQSRSTILISGESGTGKSLLAKYIHRLSNRKEQQFVEVHCGAIPESLIESELFGHEKGSFTGAIKKRLGKFELANQGTIFLDEIGTISMPVQVRLLQVLQERFIQRVGGESNIPLDIRIIAATNSDLKSAVQRGVFREDLYYRLNVFQIEIPPLRNRKEDIPLIGSNILKKLNRLYGRNVKYISQEVLSIFHNYDWPGNIRELENIIERGYILTQGDTIKSESVPVELISQVKSLVQISPLNKPSLGLVEARKAATEAFEFKYLTELLIAHHGKVSSMAKIANVSVRQIHKLLAKHSIKPKDFSIELKD